MISAEVSPIAAPEPRAGAERRLRTYLVEDNPTIRESLQAALDELVGITLVGFASDERSASDALLHPQTDWDLAIVDIALHEGTGFGVLQACKERDSGRKMVVLSNYATPAVRERCLALGADAVFDKSTDIDALIDYCRGLPQER
ncbi:response regulator [Comamonas sp. NLF-1-9]|nr:response regulator [Comamonas sp. NLF-1-9]QXL85922.1 response regulator [Comamonas sp. NLF-1-9]